MVQGTNVVVFHFFPQPNSMAKPLKDVLLNLTERICSFHNNFFFFALPFSHLLGTFQKSQPAHRFLSSQIQNIQNRHTNIRNFHIPPKTSIQHWASFRQQIEVTGNNRGSFNEVTTQLWKIHQSRLMAINITLPELKVKLTISANQNKLATLLMTPLLKPQKVLFNP